MIQPIPRTPDNESGFTLVEVLIASVILIVGLVAVAYCFGLGLAVVSTAREDTIARQKAREAMESVFTGRNTSILTFDQICNISAGTNCIFVNGFTNLTTAGADGIVNTLDDGPVEAVWTPGADGILGTTDDIQIALTNYQRQIQITTLTAILKQITITIKYTTPGGISRTVTLNAMMSPYA